MFCLLTKPHVVSQLNTNDFPIINKNNLMGEIEKVKKMLVNKIKAGQGGKLVVI